VYGAIKAGYRLLDSAGDYGNEKEAGEGLRRAIADGLVKREEICKSIVSPVTLSNVNNLTFSHHFEGNYHVAACGFWLTSTSKLWNTFHARDHVRAAKFSCSLS
jgi:D-xylose reductase